MTSIQAKLHVKYFQKCLQCLPGPYSSLDTNRLTVAYFCTSALDLLGALDAVEAAPIVEWIYAQQVVPPADGGGNAPPANEEPVAPAPAAAQTTNQSTNVNGVNLGDSWTLQEHVDTGQGQGNNG